MSRLRVEAVAGRGLGEQWEGPRAFTRRPWTPAPEGEENP